MDDSLVLAVQEISSGLIDADLGGHVVKKRIGLHKRGKRIRVRNKASQAVFAAYLNTSPSTVQKGEQGQKKPNGPSLTGR